MARSVEKFWCQGPVQCPKHARVGVRARTQGGLMVGEGVPTRPKCFGGIMFLCFSFSLGPLTAEIHLFSEGVSENHWKSETKEITNFTRPAEVWGPSKKNFSYISRGLGGIFWPKTPTDTHLEHPKKWFLLLKEPERVWNSGFRPLSRMSGWNPSTRWEFWDQRSSGSFFVSEIWPFEVDFPMRSNST